jgi:hypothetical protein
VLLVDAFMAVAYRKQMIYLKAADKRHPHTPGYKSHRMARFWASHLLRLRLLQRGAWKGDASFAAYVAHATDKLTPEERELSFTQADEMLRHALAKSELKARLLVDQGGDFFQRPFRS